MACKEYRGRLDRLEDYLDGRLDEAASREVTAHLERCTECRAEMEAAQLSVRLLREGVEPAPEASGVFWTRLRARVREEASAQGAGDFWPALELLARRLSLASALALLLLGAYLVDLEWQQGSLFGSQQSEARELFPEPVRQPANHEEVLVSLATNGNGR